MILYHAADLIWASRIRAACEDAAIHARPVRSLDMLQARLADSPPNDPVRALLVDLDAPEPALALITAMHAARPSLPSPVTIIAFGPHVAVEAFAAARQAGADTLLARGALARQLEDVLRACA